jgi:hypothetical protein
MVQRSFANGGTMSQVSNLEGHRRWKAANPKKVKEYYQARKADHRFRDNLKSKNWYIKKTKAAKRVIARIGDDDDLGCMAKILFT